MRLPAVAHRLGYEATHVVHFGLGEWKDWSILEVVKGQGWVLVTNNAFEFRSRYRTIETNPGVIFLLPSVLREQQLLLFEAALDNVVNNPDLINQVSMSISPGTEPSSFAAMCYPDRMGLVMRQLHCAECRVRPLPSRRPGQRGRPRASSPPTAQAGVGANSGARRWCPEG